MSQKSSSIEKESFDETNFVLVFSMSFNFSPPPTLTASFRFANKIGFKSLLVTTQMREGSRSRRMELVV